MPAKCKTGAPAPRPEMRTLSLQDNFSYRLSMLNFLMGKMTQGIYSPEGLSSHQWKVLSVLYAYGPMPASEIGLWVTFDKAAISRAVHQLRTLGLAERKVREADRRTKDVGLTQRGQDVYAGMARHMAQIQSRLFRGIPKDDVKTLFKLIGLLEKRVNDELARPAVGSPG